MLYCWWIAWLCRRPDWLRRVQLTWPGPPGLQMIFFCFDVSWRSVCNRGCNGESFHQISQGLEFLASRSSSESSSPIRLGAGRKGIDNIRHPYDTDWHSVLCRLEALIPYWQQRVTKSWGAWLCTQTKQTLAQAVSCSGMCTDCTGHPQISQNIQSS